MVRCTYTKKNNKEWSGGSIPHDTASKIKCVVAQSVRAVPSPGQSWVRVPPSHQTKIIGDIINKLLSQLINLQLERSLQGWELNLLII